MGAICGIIENQFENKPERGLLDQMLKVMAHRGRGEGNLFLNGNVALAWKSSYPMTRSTICSPQICAKFPVCVFDGLLFNYDDFDAAIDQQERDFLNVDFSKIISDLYFSIGLSFLEKLDGVFALAIWDPEKRQLLLARDRFGTRPLYYCENNGRILFASEMKGIFSVISPKPAANLAVLPEYLTFRSVLGPRTFVNDIREVRPGYYILIKNGEITEKKYWDIEDSIQEGSIREPAFYEMRLEELLRKAVIKRASFSKRIGANCSGGIDSGLVTAFASAIHNEGALETYTVGFNEKGWDERFYAGLTARKYGTRHSEIVVKSGEFIESLEYLNWQNDEPLSDPNSVLLYLLGKFSRDRIDILLTGEGADEALLGYPRYNLLNLYSVIRSLPKLLQVITSWGCSIVPNRRLGKLHSALKYGPLDAVVLNSSFVASGILRSILKKDLLNIRFEEREGIVNSLRSHEDVLYGVMIYDIKTYTANSLKRLDKMNMAVGLEVVNPFLDKELFEFVLNVPRKYKINYFNNKIILRDIARKHLPQENMKMPKSGFGVPIGEWLAGNSTLRTFFEEMFLDREINKIFEVEELRKIFYMHRERVVDHSEILWLILNFYLWHTNFYRNQR
jgi:asparagine synthase (glutamine-hydrolysing)